MGQHIIANRLAVAKPRAMAHHEPAIGAQHRQMVGDVLGVRWADTDVDEGYAGISVPRQMVGGHLVAVPGRAGHQRLRLGGRMPAAYGDVARQYEALKTAIAGKLLASPAHKLIHIAVIIGQQNPALDMAPVASRIVNQPAQGKIGTHRIEQSKRIGLPLPAMPQAVRDLVANGGEPGRREMAGKLVCGDIRAGDLLRTLDHIRVGNLLGADAGLDFRAILRDKRFELLQKIAAEGARMRNRGLVDAWVLQLAERAKRGRARMPFLAVDHPQRRIMEFRARSGRRRYARVEVSVQRGGERRGGFGVQLFEPVDSGGRAGML